MNFRLAGQVLAEGAMNYLVKKFTDQKLVRILEDSYNRLCFFSPNETRELEVRENCPIIFCIHVNRKYCIKEIDINFINFVCFYIILFVAFTDIFYTSLKCRFWNNLAASRTCISAEFINSISHPIPTQSMSKCLGTSSARKYLLEYIFIDIYKCRYRSSFYLQIFVSRRTYYQHYKLTIFLLFSALYFS